MDKPQIMHRSLLSMLWIVLVFTTPSYGQAARNYFYAGRDFGSEAMFHPITLIVNGGYGIMQVGNRDKNLFNVHYGIAFKNVIENLTHPIQSIEEFGWKTFVRTEIVPTSLKPRSAQYFPNYQLHLIGGGMTYRMLLEWYRHHDIQHPTRNALFTIAVYHLLNELVENDAYEGVNVDAIADLYLFDPLGILLFNFEAVSRFFSKTLNMADWSFMPTYNPYLRTLENNGQSFVIKYALPGAPRLRFFYFFGMNGVMGLSYKRKDGTSLSFGGGFMAKDLVRNERNDNIRSLTASLIWNIGFFYDKDNSLLASLLFSGSRVYKARLNIYPGILSFGKVSPGFFCAIGNQNEVILGARLVSFPVGLATALF